MGLYLAVFHDDKELDGVEIGSYGDFGWFRDTVVERLEDGVPGSKFPTLIMHSDCDGQWTPEEAVALERELEAIAEAFKRLPPIDYYSRWQEEVASEFGIRPKCLLDCLFDVDGEPLLARLAMLARLAKERRLPILFQ